MTRQQTDKNEAITGRNSYIDFIKGIAILLVLVGHAIQYCYGAEYFVQGTYFGNPIFKFIYTFHMPLFMAVSGYLLAHTLSHRTEREVAVRRLRQLGIPILSFGALAFAIKWTVHPIYDIAGCIKELFHTCVGNLWFLWALLYNQLLLLLIRRIGDKVWMYVLAGILIYFIPDSDFIPAQYTFLYPFLIMGYMTSKYSLEKIYTGKERMRISVGMLVLYTVALYASHMPCTRMWDWGILSHILHTCNRQLIAIFALGWILPLLYGLFRTFSTTWIADFIANTGRNSLAIYYIQTLIFILVSRICHMLPSYGILGVLIGGMVITAECILLAQWCKQFKCTRLLIWGSK